MNDETFTLPNQRKFIYRANTGQAHAFHMTDTNTHTPPGIALISFCEGTSGLNLKKLLEMPTANIYAQEQ